MPNAKNTTGEASAKARRMPRSQRKQQMLKVAADLFGTKGYDATSMDDIASACGITKPMVYSYFQSKEGLYAAMIEHAGSYLVDTLPDVAKNKTAKEAMLLSMDVFLNFVDQYRSSWWVLFSGEPTGQKETAELEAYRKKLVMFTVFIMARLRPEGADSAAARAVVEPYAHALHGACKSVARWWLNSPDTPKSDAHKALLTIVESMITLVTSQLLPLKPQSPHLA